MGACSGKLVALSDQDDLWRKDRIAHAAAEFDRCPELDLLLSDARLVDRDGTPLGRTLFEALEVSGPDLARIDSPGSFPMLLKRHLVTGATVMLRSRLLGSALPFSPDWVQDEWLAIIAAATGRLDIVDQPLIDHRQHDSNLIGVVYPTLQRQEQRALKPQGDRKDSVADHFERFAGRMQSLGTAGTPPVVAFARDKTILETELAHFNSAATSHRIDHRDKSRTPTRYIRQPGKARYFAEPCPASRRATRHQAGVMPAPR